MESESVTPKRRFSLSSIWKNSEIYVISVMCPDNSTIYLVHNVKETANDVLLNACNRLGIEDVDYYGLAKFDSNEYRFLPLRKSLEKVFPRLAKLTNEEVWCDEAGTTCSIDGCMKSCRLYLRAKHFPPQIHNLKQRTRFWYIQQLRLDFVRSLNMLNLAGPDELSIKLATCALMVTFREEMEQKLKQEDACISSFLPQKTILNLSDDEIMKRIIELSNSYTDMTYDDLEVEYLMDASTLVMYGMYFFRIKLLVTLETKYASCWFGVSPKGLSAYCDQGQDGWHLSFTLQWEEVKEITFVQCNVHFVLEGTSEKEQSITVETYTEDDAKYIQRFCHQEQMFQLQWLKEKTKKTSLHFLSKQADGKVYFVASKRRTSLPELAMRGMALMKPSSLSHSVPSGATLFHPEETKNEKEGTGVSPEVATSSRSRKLSRSSLCPFIGPKSDGGQSLL